MNKNPFFEKWETPYGSIPFDKIKTEDYLPAIDKALAIARENIQKVKNDQSTPNFDNTILALETSQEELQEITGVYYNLMSCESDNEFKELANVISPKLAEFGSEISLDETLFEKVKAVYEGTEDLNPEQRRLVDINYKSFIRNGALLDQSKKTRLKDLDQELSVLSPQYSKNLLNATNAFQEVITDENELIGLPETVKQAAKELAVKKGIENGWMFSLQAPSYIPVLTYSKNRALREKLSRAYSSKAFKDEYDNSDLVKKIVTLRHERAELLGFKSHADYVLEQRMAQNPKTVHDFLEEIYQVALPAAQKEIEEIKAIAKRLDNIEEIQSWDTAYYSEILKKEKYDFNEEELKPYFKMENAIEGLFIVANKLYGIKFKQVHNIPVYHPDVTTYEVHDEDDSFLGILYSDLFPRETKRDGAWMTSFRSQGLYKGKVERPLISIVANLTPSTADTPSLLRLNEVQTLFHEFGHALHGLLSSCVYPALASPNVYWDFVELPSQIMENWVTEEDALSLFAKHYQTGEIIPKELIEKVKKAEKFNKGLFNIRQLIFGMLDMAWHDKDNRQVNDIEAFEDEVIERLRLVPKVQGTLTSTTFSHVFSGGYASGYYSYKWAEVLDADAFEKFIEDGIFNKHTAHSFRENILSKGNTEHPMDLYVRFRGRKPDPNASLKRDGLK